MPEPLLWVEDNTSPNLALTLQRNGSDISLASASKVELIIANDQTNAITNAGHQEATITDAAGGEISYAPEAADFPQAGRFKGDAKITYISGRSEILVDQLVVIVRAKNS
jgi:hypothetical protein